MKLSEFWANPARYWLSRDRFPEEVRRPISALREELTVWAARHDGIVDVVEAARFLREAPGYVERALSAMPHIERVGKGFWSASVGAPLAPKPPVVETLEGNPRGRNTGKLMRALIEWGESHGGEVQVEEAAGLLGITGGAVRGALKRAGFELTGTPGLWRQGKESA